MIKSSQTEIMSRWYAHFVNKWGERLHTTSKPKLGFPVLWESVIDMHVYMFYTYTYIKHPDTEQSNLSITGMFATREQKPRPSAQQLEAPSTTPPNVC